MTQPLREGRGTEPFSRIPPELGARLRAQVPSLVEEALEDLRRRSREHSAPLGPADAERLRRALAAGVHGFLDRVEVGGPSPALADALASEFRALGAAEARHGRTLECLHTGMRAAAAVAWRRLAAADALTREHMGVVGEAIFVFQEEVSGAAAEGHARVRGAGADALHRRRVRLLEALLAETGTEYDARAVSALAGAARWRAPGRVAVALLLRDGPVGRTAVLPPDVLADLDRAEPCALVPDPEGPGRLRSLERSLRGADAVLGPSVPLDRVPVSLARARDLAELVRAGLVTGGGVLRWSDHLPALLLTRDPALVGEMARTRLAPLAGLRAPQRERMADTLLAWLESGLNANEAADRLRIHPQTVRYRMRRLEELFGERLRDPAERFELELVLRARGLLGPLAEGGG
ncbi:helix-turn-helix domain-containing protein [Streptomonospora nanhaiensis]|uniref:Helix-turn-helix domain-containing protein n=1 Tax=Streptomonospora nanhaiensis TaxID=1323731 RepID=A0ABY6YS46_9ACTN|nr:PucR family transcriptional regulator [Streptomonospora nanhaiensis]WAE74923.1 helix-turn-helix domain-containing protein [Streptomonospora nanhaiensis]